VGSFTQSGSKTMPPGPDTSPADAGCRERDAPRLDSKVPREIGERITTEREAPGACVHAASHSNASLVSPPYNITHFSIGGPSQLTLIW